MQPFSKKSLYEFRKRGVSQDVIDRYYALMQLSMCDQLTTAQIAELRSVTKELYSGIKPLPWHKFIHWLFRLLKF